MYIIGERINGNSKSVKQAIAVKDADFIQNLAQKQHDAGISYIDINVGSFLDEDVQNLEWLVNIIQEVSDVPFSIDSDNPEAIKAALKANRNPKPIINSITGEKERFFAVLPLVQEFETGVIALCMDDSGMPETIDERVLIAGRLIEGLTKEGVALQDIYLDPFVRSVGTCGHYGSDALDSIRRLKSEFPEVRVACGISNISFGIPARSLMNQAFLVAAMVSGIDAPILDPLDKKLMALIYASEALLGRDKFCMNYQMKFREGLLEI